MRSSFPLLYGRSQSYDANSFSPLYSPEELGLADSSATAQFTNFQDSLCLPQGSHGSGLVVRTGTRSPRKSCGSMPGSPLGKGKASTPGRVSLLARSFSSHGEAYANESLPRPFGELGLVGDALMPPVADPSTCSRTSSATAGGMLVPEVGINSHGISDMMTSNPSSFPAMGEMHRMVKVEHEFDYFTPSSTSTNNTPQGRNVNPFFDGMPSSTPLQPGKYLSWHFHT